MPARDIQSVVGRELGSALAVNLFLTLEATEQLPQIDLRLLAMLLLTRNKHVTAKFVASSISGLFADISEEMVAERLAFIAEWLTARNASLRIVVASPSGYRLSTREPE